MKRRIVVTGIGVISSIGIGKDAFWKNLIKGTSGISAIIAFDTAKHSTHVGGEIKNFNADDYMSKKRAGVNRQNLAASHCRYQVSIERREIK